MDADFQSLYSRFYRPVLNFFARNGVPPKEREDLTQETFLRAFRGFDNFRGDASPGTWLFKIARNVLSNSRRDRQAAKRQGQEVPLEGFEENGQQFMPGGVSTHEGSGTADPLSAMLRQERKDLLRRGMTTLPQQMQYCVRLRLQDFKYREIAVAMRISVETVKAHLFQARRRLKEVLGDLFDDLNLGVDHDE